VETEFNNLLKEFDKSKKVIEESGIPSFFTRALYLLEDKIKNFTAEDKQKLSAANSKSMVAISRKIKKLSAVILESLKAFSEVFQQSYCSYNLLYITTFSSCDFPLNHHLISSFCVYFTNYSL